MSVDVKGALYRIQILCRRYTFWSYPAGLTIADTPGKQKLKYRRVYSHHFQTTIAESIHTTPNSIQCPFNWGSGGGGSRTSGRCCSAPTNSVSSGRLSRRWSWCRFHRRPSLRWMTVDLVDYWWPWAPTSVSIESSRSMHYPRSWKCVLQHACHAAVCRALVSRALCPALMVEADQSGSVVVFWAWTPQVLFLSYPEVSLCTSPAECTTCPPGSLWF